MELDELREIVNESEYGVSEVANQLLLYIAEMATSCALSLINIDLYVSNKEALSGTPPQDGLQYEQNPNGLLVEKYMPDNMFVNPPDKFKRMSVSSEEFAELSKDWLFQESRYELDEQPSNRTHNVPNVVTKHTDWDNYEKDDEKNEG